MSQVRREPFRLLFPLGALLGLAGVLPWLLFGTGLSRRYLGVFHAFTMTQAFLIAIAAGFLATLLPRRTHTPPPSPLELGLMVTSLAMIPAALIAYRLALAELAYLVALVTLAAFSLRRLRRAPAGLSPSLLLIPCALLAGVTGAVLLLVASLHGPAWVIAVGRPLVEEGVLLPLVMALAPLLTPLILDDAQPPAPPRWVLASYVVVGIVFLGSFVAQLDWPRTALLLRGLLVALVVVGAGVWRRPRARGVHRRVYQLALLLVPLGLLAAAARPALRVPLLHVTFVGGLSLLVFAVGAHVTLMHGGRAARPRRWPMATVATLTLLATATRASAEQVRAHFVEMLGLAALLWLLAAILWALYLAPTLLRPRRP